MALWPEIHCEYWFQPWPFESPTFGLSHWFQTPLLSSLLLGCVTHSIWAPCDLKVDEKRLCFPCSRLLVHLWHTEMCTCMPTHIQIYSTSLLDLWLAFVLHSTSQGWLLFCSSSKKKKFSHPMLFLLVFFHCGGRNCGWEFRPSLPTACPDYYVDKYPWFDRTKTLWSSFPTLHILEWWLLGFLTGIWCGWS